MQCPRVSYSVPQATALIPSRYVNYANQLRRNHVKNTTSEIFFPGSDLGNFTNVALWGEEWTTEPVVWSLGAGGWGQMLLRNYTQDPHFPHYDQTNGKNVVLKQSEKVILKSNLWEGVYYSLPEVGTWLKRWIWCFGKCEYCQWALLSSIMRGNYSLWRTIRKPRASQQILLKMLHIKMILNTSLEELSEETRDIHKNLEINMTSYTNYCETTYSNMIVLN